jgi:hypothetical protein
MVFVIRERIQKQNDITGKLKSLPLPDIKGTVPRDFLFRVFFMDQFSQAPDYTITAVSNFFENSRRYSQLKVHHRCQ